VAVARGDRVADVVAGIGDPGEPESNNRPTHPAGITDAAYSTDPGYNALQRDSGITDPGYNFIAFVQMNSRDEFCRRRLRVGRRRLIPAQRAPCIRKENSPALIAEFSGR
jgi:hypothetical protein